MLVIFCVLMGVTTPLVLLLTRTKPHEKRTQKRLDDLVAPKSAIEEQKNELELTKEFSDGLSGQIAQRIRNHAAAQRLEKKLQEAGWEISVGKFLVITAGSSVGAALLAHLFVGSLPIVGVGLIVGGAANFAFLRLKRGRRLKKFNEGLPESIDLMSRALKAGHSVSSAIEVVAQQSPAPIGPEFAKCAQQQRFGIPFRNALEEFSERIPSQDLYFLITAILVQKETGGDLTEILDRTTVVIRERVRIQGEIKTHTAQGRLTGGILSGLPVVLLIAINIINPQYTHVLFHDPLGQKLLYAAAGLISMGAFVISRIVDIKV